MEYPRLTSFKFTDRPSSPEKEDAIVFAKREEQGPSAEEDADFSKELAKLLSDTTEARRVDKRTAMTKWDTNVLQNNPVARKKKEDDQEEPAAAPPGTMKFTLISRRGNKPQVCNS